MQHYLYILVCFHFDFPWWAPRERSGPSSKDDSGLLWIRVQHLHPKLLDIIIPKMMLVFITASDIRRSHVTKPAPIKSYGKELSLKIKRLFSAVVRTRKKKNQTFSQKLRNQRQN